MEDLLGNPVTLSDARSQRAINAFVGGFIACESRAVDVLDAQADTSALVQAYCATLHLFAESRDAVANARPFLQRATAASLRATPREQRYIAAIRAWSQGETRRAIALHEEQAREFPRDLVSLKLGQYHCFNLGDFPAMLRLALMGQQAAPEVPYTHGMTAFGFEQCQMMREAEASARTAIKMERKEPWAQHALAHVMLTEGRLSEGLAFMQGVSDTWVGLNSFMVTHNWWHMALFLIDLGRDAEALAVYDNHAWGVDKRYSQDQIGAVSLLARCELAGIDVGARWNDLADHLASRIDDHVLPFLDLQYLYGLARAGRTEADALLRSIEAFVPDAPMSTRAVWKDICVPAAHGLLAHARGDFAAAVEHLDVAMPRLIEIGGSHAQRDLFEQVLLDALIRSADPGLRRRAQDMLRAQVSGQPESLRLRRQAARLDALLA